MNNNSIQELLVNAVLGAIPDCKAIYRFGSWGTASQKIISDIDLAVLPSSPLDRVRCWEIAQSLASLVAADIDLVDLLRASTVLRMQVLSTGERIYSADDCNVELFEDIVFSSYARLNEERHEVLADIVSRGSVYGK